MKKKPQNNKSLNEELTMKHLKEQLNQKDDIISAYQKIVEQLAVEIVRRATFPVLPAPPKHQAKLEQSIDALKPGRSYVSNVVKRLINDQILN